MRPTAFSHVTCWPGYDIATKQVGHMVQNVHAVSDGSIIG
jgi:hypothetical protein